MTGKRPRHPWILNGAIIAAALAAAVVVGLCIPPLRQPQVQEGATPRARTLYFPAWRGSCSFTPSRLPSPSCRPCDLGTPDVPPHRCGTCTPLPTPHQTPYPIQTMPPTSMPRATATRTPQEWRMYLPRVGRDAETNR